MMRRVTVLSLFFPLAGSLLLARDPVPDSQAAFARMKGLVGDWEGHVADGPPAKVEYRLTGNGSALVERLFPGTEHEMLTIYHMDGADLVLTHYCAMGNQPRMKLNAGGAVGELRFDFVGGENIDPKVSTYMHSARFTLLEKDRYEADWIVSAAGKSGANAHHFIMSRSSRGEQ